MKQLLFFLGTHMPNWLALTDAPLFVSHRRLMKRKTFPRALGPWALDSGGFSELSMYGEWRTSTASYIASVRRYMAEIGRMEWAAIQDWMCEPFITAKTGLTVEEHQRRTIASYMELTMLAPDVPWAPVIQGFSFEDYHRHVTDYMRAGVDLRTMPFVGVGSICRRQATDEAARILSSLAALGIKVHAFGLKTLGLRKVADIIESSDSMAWSLAARRQPAMPGCTHRSCANCLRFALAWRANIITEIDTPRWRQSDLFTGVA